MINKMNNDMNELERNGASKYWSTFRVDSCVDTTMSDKRAADVIAQLQHRKYIFRVKFIILAETQNWINRDKHDNSLNNKKPSL